MKVLSASGRYLVDASGDSFNVMVAEQVTELGVEGVYGSEGMA
jgi:hypothetical protein